MPDSEMIRAVLRVASSNRRLLRITYHSYSRLLEPWALVEDQAGQHVLIAWQISGGSESGAASGWKEFQVAEIAGARVLAEGFEPNPDRKVPIAAAPAARDPSEQLR